MNLLLAAYGFHRLLVNGAGLVASSVQSCRAAQSGQCSNLITPHIDRWSDANLYFQQITHPRYSLVLAYEDDGEFTVGSCTQP